MDAALELSWTWAMRLSGFVFVCLCGTSASIGGCGPEPTAKGPDTASSATTAASTAPTGTSASPEPSSTSSSGPVASASASASSVPTNPESPPSSETALVGTLTNDQIQTAINANISAFDACYTLGADKKGKLEGTVTIKATVNPLGVVRDIAVVKSTMKNPKVDGCVSDAFKKVKFPQPRGGVAIITYPMTFGGEVVIKK